MIGNNGMVREKEETLELLGLSPTQAHVYLALIKLGRSSAKTLAKNSGVACPDIYRIMDIFEKIGLIQKVIEYPKKYEATNIEQALPILVNRKREETEEIEKRIKALIKEVKLEQNTNEISSIDSDLILFPGTKIIIQKTKETIRNAENSIEAVISWKAYKSYTDMRLGALTKKAIAKGVKFRFIIENPKNLNLWAENDVLKLINKNGSEIKYVTTIPSALFTIYDKKEAIIYTSNKAGSYDTPLIWTNNISIVAIVRGYFEYLWITEMQQNFITA
jgi:sugar-specific transcriptional regulator TrmB